MKKMLDKLWKIIKDLLAAKGGGNQENTSIRDSSLSQENSPACDCEEPSISQPFDTSPSLHPLFNPGIFNDPLDNKPWIKLAEECVELFDELDRQIKFFDPARREIADHVCCRLQEMLQRSGVELIAETALFERTLHQPEIPTAGMTNGADTAIILSPGFRVGRRVLRRARVELQNSVQNKSGES
jgi:hypothetical protein